MTSTSSSSRSSSSTPGHGIPVTRGSEPDQFGFRVVHHSLPRTDGPGKVTGKATYTADITVPGLTHAKVVRSQLAHARILSIDASAALERPGVVCVVTGQDLAQLANPRFGHAIKDHPILAIDKVRYIGEPVAVVIAEDESTAQLALDDVIVEYDELDAVMTPEEALADGAPLIHETRYGKGVSPGHVELSGGAQVTNVCQENHVQWGDVNAAFAKAAKIVEGEFRYPMTYAYAMEPYVCIADYTETGGEPSLTIHACAQHPFMSRSDVAAVFGMPLNQVRVISPLIGGGYGSKSYTKIEPLTAVCSWKAKRPVKLELTIDESILTTRADDSHIFIKTAIDAEGKLLARKATIYMNTGAFAENSPLVSSKAAIRLIGPYIYEALDITSFAVYTNTCPASSYRGFGAAQVTLAGESQMDELAELNGDDPVQFRLRSFADPGQRFVPKARGLTADVKGDVRKLAEVIGWDDPLLPNRGRGMAIAVIDSGAQPIGRSEVRVLGDGSVTVLTGSAEMGQGSRTVLAQIAAEEFGLGLEQVRVVMSDTGQTPFARSTGADRTTTLEGRTVLGACRVAKDKLKQMAADIWEADETDLVLTPNGVMSEGREMSWREIIGKYFGIADMEVSGAAEIRQKDELAELPPFWEPAIAAVEVEVFPDTGRLKVHKLVTVADVGLAINPSMAEGQDLGSATMGLGVALAEELVYDGQQLSNGSMLDYRVPRFTDVPEEFHGIIVENRDGVGPYGAKGVGDGPTAAMSAAIANAVYRAIGVRLRQAPFTPERVWRAILEKEQASQAVR